jgi:hypothetical protein
MMKAIQLTQTDNVATVLDLTPPNTEIDILCHGEVINHLISVDEIPYGFKISVANIAKGNPVIKYNHVIGKATVDIPAGSCVHVHNIEGNRGRGDLQEETNER